jgi:hypothetical protein
VSGRSPPVKLSSWRCNERGEIDVLINARLLAELELPRATS